MDQLTKTAQDAENQLSTEKVEKARLTVELDAEKDKAAELEKKFVQVRDEAAAREAELNKKIQDQAKTIAGDQDHDAADHKALDDAHESLTQEQKKTASLTKTLDGKEMLLLQAQTQVKVLLQQTSDLKSANAELQGSLETEKEQNEQLTAISNTLKTQVAKIAKDLAFTQKTLSQTKQDLEQALKDSEDKDTTVEDLERGIEGVQRDRDTKKRALAALKKSSEEEMKRLQSALTAMRAHDADDHDKLNRLDHDLKASVDREHLDEAEVKTLQREIEELKAKGSQDAEQPPEQGENAAATLVSFHASLVSVPAMFGGAENMTDVVAVSLTDGKLGKWMNVYALLSAQFQVHALYSRVTGKFYVAPASGVYPPAGISDSVEIRGTFFQCLPLSFFALIPHSPVIPATTA